MGNLRRALPLILGLALLLTSFPAALAAPTDGEAGDVVRVLVRASPGSELERELQAGSRSTLSAVHDTQFELVSEERSVASFGYHDYQSALRALAELKRHPDVLIAELDLPRQLLWEPVDEPEFDSQRGWVEQVNLPAAWNITTGAETTVVAVIDSGVSPTHPDLAGKLIHGYNAVDDDEDWHDINGHGTHLAGIIAASGSNGVGTVGAAMDVQIMPIRVLDDRNLIATSAIARAIYWAVDHGADVINLSLGADSPSQIERDAVVFAYDNGIPVLAAAGNQPTRISYPASYPETISIGALTSSGSRAPFSSVVSDVDVAAPGVLIFSPTWSASEGDGWSDRLSTQAASGTSFSTAIASGVAALMLSVNGDLEPEDVREILRSTATDSGEPGLEAGVGAGQIDAEAAVRMTTFAAMHATWYPADGPVAAGEVQRTWLWGVDPPPYFAYETYAEAQHHVRLVYYYDKSRMEVTDPLGDRSQAWYVTNGLLVNELVTGELQVGDGEFETRFPAAVNVAGDPDDAGGPTYSTFASVLDVPPVDADLPISQTIARDGTVGSDSSLISHGVVGAYYEEITGHRVASVFWDYLNSTGPISGAFGLEEGQLFDPWFFATGLPITEAYWATVKVADVVQDVLIQCFERRCLTYTPANPDGWRVEMGNVGMHYYTWRYGEVPEPPVVEPPVEPQPPTVEPPARGEALFTAGFDAWSDAETADGTRTIVDEGMLFDVVVEGAEIGVLVPQLVAGDAAAVATVRAVDAEGGAFCVIVRFDPGSGSRYQGCVNASGDVSLTYATADGVELLIDEPGYVASEQLSAGIEISVSSVGDTHWLEIDGTVIGSSTHAGRPEGSMGMFAAGIGTFLVTAYAVYGAG